MKWTIFIFCLIVIQISLYIVKLKSEIRDLQLYKEHSKETIRRQHIRIMELTVKQEMGEKLKIPNGTIEAVRYAMVRNHPDNGGDAEKFILYKKCYDKLTGGKKQ